MSNLAYYTSFGRIQELIVFDYRSYDISETSSFQEVSQTITEMYRQFAAPFTKTDQSLIQFYILFDVINPKKWTKWHDKESNISFIPTNTILAEATIPSSWAQDLLHIIPLTNGKVEIRLNEDEISQELEEVIAKEIGHTFTLSSFAGLPPGGNIIIYKKKGLDQIVMGHNLNVREDNNNPNNIGIFSPNSKASVCKLKWPFEDTLFHEKYLKRIFFHIDQYLTPIGCNKDGEAIFLVPDIKKAKWAKEERYEVLEKLKESILSFTETLGIKKENLIPVPLFILRSEDEPYALSYNNCIAENQKENDLSKTYIYFPDFRSKVAQFIRSNSYILNNIGFAELLVVNEIAKRFIRHIQVFKSFENEEFDQIIETEKAIVLSDKYITQIHERLKEDFSSMGIPKDNIRFVSLDFPQSAKRHGSLHCHTKVIARDILI
jgi:hypothetical protein